MKEIRTRVANTTLVILSVITLASLVYAEIAHITGNPNIFQLTPGEPFDVASRYLLGTISFGLQLGIVSSLVLKDYRIRVILISFVYAIIAQVMFAFNLSPMFYLNTIFPNLIILIVSATMYDLKSALKRIVPVNLIIIIIQPIFSIVRDGFFTFSNNAINEHNWIFMSVDLLIILIIFYVKGGGKFGWHWHWFDVVLAGEKHDLQGSESDSEHVQEYLNQTGTARVISRIVVYGFQLLQCALILIPCAFLGVFVEGFVVTTAFIGYGMIIKKRVHIEPITCTIVSVILFTLVALMMPQIKYSWSIPVAMAFLIVYGSYKLSESYDDYKRSKSIADSLNHRT